MLNIRILRVIIDEKQPITTYKIAKLLNESFNAVKYNIKKLEQYKAIVAVKKDNKAIYYIPNKLFTKMDAIIEYLEPFIKEAMDNIDMNEDNAKNNFKMLLNLIIDDINGKSNKKS